MRRIILIISLGIILLTNTYSQSNDKLTFQDFPIENISIRAIEIANDSTLWFAGSDGKYGRIINNKIKIESLENKDLHFRSIAFNGKNIFILSIENPAVLYKIDSNSDAPEPIEAYRETNEKVFYDSMQFFDEKNGIAMGDPTEDCLSVITTQDGGNSWKKISCNNLPKVYDGEAAFAASNTNIAICKNNVWLVSGGKKSRIFYSPDKGKNWKAFNTPIVQGKTMTGIFTVDFYDEKNGIIMGGNWEEKDNFKNTKAITKDGGKTWNLISNGKEPGYISCVQYVPDSKGTEIFAVSTEGIYQSENSGVTWRKISTKRYYTIRFVDKNTAWLAGKDIITRIKIEE
ncbi:MAG: oxidoreductase [Bacteroidota bacterium]